MKKHKFNVLDVIIIFIIIAAVAVGGYIFLRFNKTAMMEGKPVTVEFSVEVTNLSYEVANSFTIGAPVVYGTTNSDSGVISDVVITPYRRMMRNIIDGEYSFEQFADRHTATVTIRADVYETENAFMGAREQIMIGTSMPFRGLGFAGPNCFIVDMRVVE